MDGLWIDMNEISNFCHGACSAEDVISDKKWLHDSNFQKKTVTSYKGFDPMSPPYAIDNQGIHAPLSIRTVSPDAVHYGGVLEYNTHNLYGKRRATNICVL